jgi:phosphoesterase RecJ-like protein
MNINRELLDFFKTNRKILITTHIRPDGDAIGSSLALLYFLRSKGHNCMLAFPGVYANYHKWFPGIEEVIIYPHKKKRVEQFLKNTDLVIAVDFNNLKRNAELGEYLSKLDQPKLLIDHHPEPDDDFRYRIWDTHYCAAGEAVFDFIDALDPDSLKDRQIATCLYAAIISDSGSFRFPSVTQKTFHIASRLLESGIEHSQIQRDVFDNFSEKRLRFWGHCVTQKMTLLDDLNVAYISVEKEDFAQFNTKASDTENLVNFAMNIKKVHIAALLVEHDGFIKISLRSKNQFAVNEIAKKYFNGGGHINAAGGESKSDMETAIQELRIALREYVEVQTVDKK